MFIQQLYTNCLSEAAYYVESNGEAVVVDPLRDYREYTKLASERKATIKYVFETHFHADFVSGHIDLAKQTGSRIVFGPQAETNFDAYNAKDGERFQVGAITIEVMHTPGHTPDSSCYLLRDENGKPHCIFTGDTLFVGDVGRPDLFGTKISKEDLAGMLYDSLATLKALPDDVIVYPAHGPGSSCGKNIGKETWSTIGEQKKLNYAMQEQTREEFIKNVTTGLTAPPRYFPLNATLNKQGAESFDTILKNIKALSVNDVESLIHEGVYVLDVRHENEFENGFIPGSFFVGLHGRFAEWVGTLFDIKQPFVIVAPAGQEEETIIRMSRVGYDNVKGYLQGGFEAWKNAGKPFDMIISVDTEELDLDLKHDNITVVDVRKNSEFVAGHIEDAINVPLQSFETSLAERDLPKDEKLFVHCQGGYRSMIAASILRRKGFEIIRNVLGGYNAISKTIIKTVQEKLTA
ncbi:MAG TPA: rhodanese-like domain-containing protein [Chitinophagales bacterium]|nr:rhodanese-like domain-containing protein [Chitinophagales bacterium]